MVDGTLLSINLAGGISVLMGYTFISMTGVGKKLARVFNANEMSVFLTLSTLSIISFFYLVYWASSTGTLKDWRYTLYLISLAVYLLGASLWSPTIYRIVTKKQHPYNQIPALFITGAGTVGMLAAIAAESSEEDLRYSFAMAAAIILVLQHAIFDLCYWTKVHSNKLEQVKRL